MNKIQKYIDIANSPKKEVFNILTFPTHERYETQLCKTGHQFFSCNIKGGKSWNVEQTPVPSNYHLLPQDQLCDYIDYDFILVQSRYWQYNIALQINNRLGLPVIVLDHTLPPENMAREQIKALQSMVGNVNVFISEFSQNAWGITENSLVIRHGIDTDLFRPLNTERKSYALTVGNDFIKRNYCLHYDWWCELTNDIENKIVGDTEGLSAPAASLEELVQEYNTCGVYINTSTTPIPMSLLEAMSCGCAVVTVAASMMPEIIVNGVNGFISNDMNELKSYIKLVLSDSKLRDTLGQNARKTILEQFSEAKFINNWQQIFKGIYEVSIL